MSQTAEEESLFKNVQDLRKRLQQTQKNLQNFTAIGRVKEGVSNVPSSPDRGMAPLTLDDLTPPQEITESRRSSSLPPNGVVQTFVMEEHRRSDATHHSGSSGKNSTKERHSIATASVLFEQQGLQQRLQQLRDDNNKLVVQNRKLLGQMEDMGYQLQQMTAKIHHSSKESHRYCQKITDLEERIVNLEADNESQEKALSQTEGQLESYQQQIEDTENELERCVEELTNLKADLEHEVKVRQRAEDERDMALRSVEDLQESIDEYQKKAREKLKKHLGQEDHLRESLQHADHDREELLEANTALQEQVTALQQEIRQLQEDQLVEREVRSSMEQQQLDMRGQLAKQAQVIAKMDVEIKAADKLRQENLDLKAHSVKQEQKLLQCQREIGETQAMLAHFEETVSRLQRERTAKLETDSGVSMSKMPRSSTPNGAQDELDGSYLETLKKTESNEEYAAGLQQLRLELELKESEIEHLQAELDLSKRVQPSPSQIKELKKDLQSAVDSKKLSDEHIQEQEELIGRLEEERRKHASHILKLEEMVSDLEVQHSSVEARLSQRQAHVVELQKEITERDTRVASLEREVRKRSSQLASLEGQLDAKVSEVTDHMGRVTELEEELAKRTSQLHKVKAELEERSRSNLQTDALAEKMRQLHGEQCQEMEAQIDMLEQKFERKSSQLQEAEKEVTRLQQEIAIKEAALSEAKREYELHSQQHQMSLASLQKKSSDASHQVAQMESTLVVCKNELHIQMDQLDQMRDQHDREITDREQQIQNMHAEFTETTQLLSEKEERVIELERNLDERQLMLQQSNDHIVELEAAQTELETNMSRLENEVEQQKSHWREDLGTMETKLKQACTELEKRLVQVQEMTNTIRDLAAEKKKLTDEIHSLERKIQKLRKENEKHTTNTAQLESDLRERNNELQDRVDCIEDLEEQTRSLEYDLQDRNEKVIALDQQFRAAQTELHQARRSLVELEDDLEQAQSENTKKQDLIESLKNSLRCSQDELRSRNRELEEMEHASKQRAYELQQRASQLTQLDVHLKEHQNDVQQREALLEHALQKAQFEVQQQGRRNTELEHQIQRLNTELQEQSSQLNLAEKETAAHKRETRLCKERLEQLEKHLELMSKEMEQAQHDNMELNTQVRTIREESQKLQVNLTESERYLAMARREEEKLKLELVELRTISQNKESDAGQLAEELGTAKAELLQLENKLSAEIRKLQRELEVQKQLSEQKTTELEECNEQTASSKDAKISQMQAWLDESKVRHSALIVELESAKSRLVTLESELRANKEALHATHENMVLKESQIARLEAQLSRQQRAQKVTSLQYSHVSQHHSTPESSPMRKQHRRNQEEITADDVNDIWRISGRTADDSDLLNYGPYSVVSTQPHNDSDSSGSKLEHSQGEQSPWMTDYMNTGIDGDKNNGNTNELEKEELEFLGITSMTNSDASGHLKENYDNRTSLSPERLNNQMVTKQQDQKISVLRNQTAVERGVGGVTRVENGDTSTVAGGPSALHDASASKWDTSADVVYEADEIIQRMSQQRRSAAAEASRISQTETQLLARPASWNDSDSLLGMWSQVQEDQRAAHAKDDQYFYSSSNMSSNISVLPNAKSELSAANNNSVLPPKSEHTVPSQPHMKPNPHSTSKSSLQAATISSINKNVKKTTAKPQTKRSSAGSGAISGSRTKSTGNKSRSSQNQRPKVQNNVKAKVVSPDLPSRQSIQSQYELMFRGQVEDTTLDTQGSLLDSSGASGSSADQSIKKHKTKGGGASAIHALGQQLLSQMALLSKQNDENMKAISSNLDRE